MATTPSISSRSPSNDKNNTRQHQNILLVITLLTKIPTSSLGGCRDVLLAKAEAWFASRLLRALFGTTYNRLELLFLLYHISRQAYVWKAILSACSLILIGKKPNSSTSFLADLIRSAGYMGTIIYSYNYVETTSLVRYSLLFMGFLAAVGVLGLFAVSEAFADLMTVIKNFTLRTGTTSLPILNFSIHAIKYLYKLLKKYHQEGQRLRDRTFTGSRSRHWGQPYTYSALDAETHIRLIQISRKGFFGQHRCKIVHTPLASAPPYEAISYTWGNLPRDRKLCTDDRILPVTQTIIDVIAARASFFSQTVLWIDSICINQADPFEKAIQVQLMRKIYSEARTVIAWLGFATDADECLKFLTGCAVLNRSRTDKEDFMGIGLNDTVRKAFFNLLRHPYWERAWIIQEIVVAPNVTVVYGNNYFGWNLLEEAVYLAAQSVYKFTGNFAVDPETSAIMGFKQVSVIRLLRNNFHVKNVGMPLVEVLTLSDGCKAKDPRDKVYAVLGLTTSMNEPSIKPDYIKTRSQLCIDVARHLCEHQPLGVLSKAGLGHRQSDLSLPSWVPDYTEMAATKSLSINHASTSKQAYSTTGVTETVIELHSHLPVLTTQCLIFDSIYRLGPTVHSSVSSSDKLRSIRPEDAEWLFEIDAWVRSNMTLVHHVHANESSHETLWRTMVGNACWDRGQLQRRPAPAEFGEHYRNVISQYKRLSSGGKAKELEEIVNSLSDSYISLSYSIMAIARGRRIAITEKGALAWVPEKSLKGDYIGAISGGQSCIAMRKKTMPQSSAFDFEVNNIIPEWRYVGECYVHGMMDGEALDIGTWHQIHFW